ncbi:hypothetical protein M153_220004851 [Pseudoloma neurophilia]|uniref:Uncharacterized protein n=1 Tax=Pseudoloma neurophilia TaxID=146866 RepID=A0A0R0M6X4_9MICR|nr:hypothetical protein M153_220004851 [Pseudoloma neurophilia]
MDEIREIFATNYSIVDKKIILENSVIDNKYIEIDGKTYDLLQILFYYKNKELEYYKYKDLAYKMDIKPVDSHLMYKLSELQPTEPMKKTCYNIKYDFSFILNHLLQKTYQIIVPFAPSSPINIFNCKSLLLSGDTRLPPFTKNQLLHSQRTITKPMKNHTAHFQLSYKNTQQEEIKTVALFIDDHHWSYSQFLSQFFQTNNRCPVFRLTSEQNRDDDFHGQQVFNIKLKNKKVIDNDLKKIWQIIDEFISMTQQ